MAKNQPAHGHAHRGKRTSLYVAWANMRGRCENPNNPKFHRYGGRGIRVCERWLDFAAFAEDMGERPAGATLDRRDNDGHYSKENCRWTTMRTQNRNRSDNRLLTARGRTACVTEWSGIVNLNTKTIRARLAKGWSHERILFTPRTDHMPRSARG